MSRQHYSDTAQYDTSSGSPKRGGASSKRTRAGKKSTAEAQCDAGHSGGPKHSGTSGGRSKHSGRAKRKRILYIVGWYLTIIQAVLSVVACVLLKTADLVPDKYLLVIALLLLLVLILCRLLMKKKIRQPRWIIGAVLSVLISLMMIVASLAVSKVTNTLQNITGVTIQTTEISIYVLDDDPAETITDAKDYQFGILTSLGREDTDEAIEKVEAELGQSLSISEYDGMTDLADALLSGDVGAMIIGADYVEMITDVDGYEDFDEQVRELTSYSWTEVVEAAAAYEGGSFIMYLSGIDTTGSVSKKSRSDVNILAVVNTDTKQVLLLSTPRDYYVELSISNGVKDKLTHAGIYGVEVSMETLEMLYDTDIDYYFRINFTGFEDLIDALGGITVDSEYSFTSVSGYSFTAGENYLNGAQALAFARERKAFATGDNQRGKNQMAVIRGVIDKMLTTAMLTNFSSILSSIDGCFETNMPYSSITALVKQQLSEGSSWNIQSFSVTGTGSSEYTYSLSTKAYVMIPDDEVVEEAKDLIQQVLDGETISVDED